MINLPIHVIHKDENIDLDNYTYSAMYNGVSESQTLTINGSLITIGASTLIPINVTSVEGAGEETYVYFLGTKKSFFKAPDPAEGQYL
jgi:hypothetical protein